MRTSHGSDDLVGELVEERYLIEAEIGRGAMGMVYRARHVRVGREVAIKVLHDHLVRDAVMVKRFEREAAIAARLQHRNVVGVIDVGETRFGQRLMVQELARGQSLAAIVARAPLERERIVTLVEQLLRGLEHAHAAGLVHRDLKPENVIVEKDDHGAEVPRIVDFGIAVLREGAEASPSAAGGPDIQRLTAAGVVLGTPPYMAPEQAYALDPDPRTDLFALGVMVYEMLSGRHPFEGTSMEIVIANATQDPPAICERAPGSAPDPLLESFARKLMARKLRDRFQTAGEALDVLVMIARLERDRAAAERRLDVREATTDLHERL
ncbi:MAG: serine/threonine protein kinase, partial [Deltaproteobacteria bacterium]|nr:serine/threonine protein kinase [Deltaproteobacteria bacterium]